MGAVVQDVRKISLFAGSVALSLAAGALGSFFTFEAIGTWYSTLNKPFFNPPNWLFGPVWTTLYILMGIALYLVAASPNSANRKVGLYFFGIQLVLNALWSVIFFGFKSPEGAFAEILLLWFAIFFTMKYFYRVNVKAMWLLVPYILWVSFAMLLNLSIAVLN